MRDTVFADCQLVAADLRGVSLHKQTLRHVDLSEANLSGADLRDAVLEGCRLRDARLVDARMAGADLRRADLGVLTPPACVALRGAVVSSAQAAELVRGRRAPGDVRGCVVGPRTLTPVPLERFSGRLGTAAAFGTSPPTPSVRALTVAERRERPPTPSVRALTLSEAKVQRPPKSSVEALRSTHAGPPER